MIFKMENSKCWQGCEDAGIIQYWKIVCLWSEGDIFGM